jgi:hypothetical protein
MLSVIGVVGCGEGILIRWKHDGMCWLMCVGKRELMCDGTRKFMCDITRKQPSLQVRSKYSEYTSALQNEN